MKLASESGIEVLEFSLCNVPKQNKDDKDQRYILGWGVLENKSLNKLVLN